MPPKHLSIKEWATEDKPREKLIEKGRKALSDAELLAILLGSGTRSETAVQLAQRILNATQNNLADLSQWSVHDFCQAFKGIGPAKAVTIISALELGYRRSLYKQTERFRITSSQNAFQYVFPFLTEMPFEEVWAIYLNQKNEILQKQCIGSGGIRSASADIQKIFQYALESRSTGLVLAHNHPSGDPSPGQEDKHLTRQVGEAAKIFSIRLLDHIILGSDTQYFSFADEGLL